MGYSTVTDIQQMFFQTSLNVDVLFEFLLLNFSDPFDGSCLTRVCDSVTFSDAEQKLYYGYLCSYDQNSSRMFSEIPL